MRNKATSGFPLLVCASVCTIVVLLSVAGTDAKRGCSAFGHSCFGGHGKRFDPNLQSITLQGNEIPTSGSIQEAEAYRLNNEFIVPEQKFRGQQSVLFPQTHRQASVKLDPYTLSSIVRQWVYEC